MDIVELAKIHTYEKFSDWLDKRYILSSCILHQYDFACLHNTTDSMAYFSYDPVKDSWKRTSILLYALSVGI